MWLPMNDHTTREPYYEDKVMLGPISLWLLAYEKRWQAETGAGAIICSGTSDSFEGSKAACMEALVTSLNAALSDLVRASNEPQSG